MTRLDPVHPGEVLRHDFGTDAQSWINLQDRYELALAERRVGDALQAIRPHAVA